MKPNSTAGTDAKPADAKPAAPPAAGDKEKPKPTPDEVAHQSTVAATAAARHRFSRGMRRTGW
jgi:hypothetical protein